MTLSYIKSWLLSLFHNTALPQMMTRALISFQQTFTLGIKMRQAFISRKFKCSLQSLMPVVNSNGI